MIIDVELGNFEPSFVLGRQFSITGAMDLQGPHQGEFTIFELLDIAKHVLEKTHEAASSSFSWRH
jgi:hypothetical protein